jgi:hypothetical protein
MAWCGTPKSFAVPCGINNYAVTMRSTASARGLQEFRDALSMTIGYTPSRLTQRR